PRFGFAYSPSNLSGFLGSLLGSGQTSIRGGFGMSYDVLFFNIMTVAASNYPRVVNSDTTDNLNRFPALAPKIATLRPFDPMFSFVNAPEDLKNPTTNFWSFSLQRKLANNELELGYTGDRSNHQIRQILSKTP